MWCPFCSSEDTRVIDSRLGDDGGTVRRRRECQDCNERFTTFERAEISMPWIIKMMDAGKHSTIQNCVGAFYALSKNAQSLLT